MTAYGRIVGTGGIGTGLMYRLDSNRSLGRNESRMATRLPVRDFCKQHIILHYLAVLLRDLHEPVEVVPIGAVGDDAMGHELLASMQQAGLRLDQVRVLADAPTLSAVCYQFPDGSGGNLTEKHSACERVSPRSVERTVRALGRCRGRLMVLAAPEVPLDSRLRLLELGRRRNAFNAASFTVDELPVVRRGRTLALVDLLAVNIDEAAALAGTRRGRSAASIVASCIDTVARRAPHLKLAITNGRHGAPAWETGHRLFLP
ncbi:carbohydrate kinase family protein, partial [bacterium]|nr:carbohydrate kinase family protein [bacterium]